MAQSSFVTRQFSSENFVESCGAILFDLSDAQDKKVCLVKYVKEDKWLLAKGRRNCGEARKDAAIREVIEETGYQCDIYPVTMPTRAPPPDEPADLHDKPRVYADFTEPFMCQLREIEEGSGIKIIWWYIAALGTHADVRNLSGEPRFRPQFFPCAEAIQKLHFQNDREVLAKAIELVA